MSKRCGQLVDCLDGLRILFQHTVDFGSITVSTNASNEVVADVWRKVSRDGKKAEEEFLENRPVTITQDGTMVTIRSRGKPLQGWSWRGRNQNEGKHTLSVPARFNVNLKTAGGGITVKDLAGDVKANTSGGFKVNRAWATAE